MGVSESKGYNKDPTIQGAILGSPIFGKSHVNSLQCVRPGSSALSCLEVFDALSMKIHQQVSE